PLPVVVTVIVTVAEAFADSDPRVHTIVELPLQLPWLADAETSVTFPGSWSWKAPDATAAGPWFWIVAVYTICWPAFTTGAEPDSCRSRSAWGGLVTSMTTTRPCRQPPGGLADTQPRSTILPGCVVATTIDTVAEAFAASGPKSQRTVGLPLQ